MNRSEYIQNIILFAYNLDRPIIPKKKADMIFHELNKCGKRINAVVHMCVLLQSVESTDIKELTECYIALFEVYDRYLWRNK